MKRDAGFTLIEMLVVLAIMALAAVIAATMLSRQPGFVERSRMTAALKARLQSAREQSQQTGRPISVTLGQGETVADALPSKSAGMVFYADGSSTGGIVSIAGAPMLKVDWLTGAIDAP